MCFVMFPVIFIVKAVSGAVGKIASRTILSHLGDPLSKAKTLHKFQDQMWQLVIHVSMSALEIYILFVEDGGEEWLSNPYTLWEPMASAPRSLQAAVGEGCARFQLNKQSVHLMYLIQMAIWIDTCISHRFFEVRN